MILLIILLTCALSLMAQKLTSSLIGRAFAPFVALAFVVVGMYVGGAFSPTGAGVIPGMLGGIVAFFVGLLMMLI